MKSLGDADQQKNKQKQLAITLLILISVLLAGIINVVTGLEIVYTHFFYLPIVVTGIWYYKNALWVALMLGGYIS